MKVTRGGSINDTLMFNQVVCVLYSYVYRVNHPG